MTKCFSENVRVYIINIYSLKLAFLFIFLHIVNFINYRLRENCLNLLILILQSSKKILNVPKMTTEDSYRLFFIIVYHDQRL